MYLNKIGCITWIMGVLIFILHYVLVQTLKCGMCRRQPPLPKRTYLHIKLNKLVVFSHWCMVTESIMKWVFWYLSYIMSSYKHWNVECVGDNHPLIVLNNVYSLVVFSLYWCMVHFCVWCKYHEMGFCSYLV